MIDYTKRDDLLVAEFFPLERGVAPSDTAKGDDVRNIARFVYTRVDQRRSLNVNKLETPWVMATEQTRKEVIADVLYYLNRPYITDSDAHAHWAYGLLQKGWKYGEERSEDHLTHPSLIPWTELDRSEKDIWALVRVSVKEGIMQHRTTLYHGENTYT